MTDEPVASGVIKTLTAIADGIERDLHSPFSPSATVLALRDAIRRIELTEDENEKLRRSRNALNARLLEIEGL